jgi:hypothetical protein
MLLDVMKTESIYVLAQFKQKYEKADLIFQKLISRKTHPSTDVAELV